MLKCSPETDPSIMSVLEGRTECDRADSPKTYDGYEETMLYSVMCLKIGCKFLQAEFARDDLSAETAHNNDRDA
jgi:hypothetical protein